MKNNDWHVFTGTGKVTEDIEKYERILQMAPPWRDYSQGAEKFDQNRSDTYLLEDPEKIDLINAALLLQKPLLVTGPAGVGKSSLAYSIANELGLGKVIVWPITSRSTVKDALYKYEIMRQLQSAMITRPIIQDDTNKKPRSTTDRQHDRRKFEKLFTLRQLGVALTTKSDLPRVLLVDEIDKSDMDLPNDLLHVLEYGRFKIDEWINNENHKLLDFEDNKNVTGAVDSRGWVNATRYPVIVMTSNGEREFPAPFLRRCITIDLKLPTQEQIVRIVHSHYKQWLKNHSNEYSKSDIDTAFNEIIKILGPSDKINVPVDKFLNAVHLFLTNKNSSENEKLLKQIVGVQEKYR